MKVLILHQHFKTPESGGAIRSWYLAQALVANAIETVVITAHNKSEYEIKNQDGVEIHYLPVFYDNKFRFLARVSSFLRFTWKSFRIARKFQDVQCCYAISVPLTVGITALWIKRRYKIPFVFEVGDLWPEAPIQMGFAKNYLLKKLLYVLEKTIYLRADSIVALSTSIQASIQKTVPGKKIHLIPNMADCDFYRPSQKDSANEEKFNVRNKLVVSYIGAFGLANGLDYIIECANTCRKQNLPIHFILCGDGAVRERLKGHAMHLGLTNLSFIEFQSREGVREILSVTDACFICYKNLPVLGTGSPNKLFDGLASGKLIIVNVEGWMKAEMEANLCGIYVDPNQPLDFVNQVTKFISDPGLLTQYQMGARKLAEQKYSRVLLSKKFVEIFR